MQNQTGQRIDKSYDVIVIVAAGNGSLATPATLAVSAAMLNLPVITLAQKVDIDDGKVLVERIIDNGFEVIEASLLAVVMASNEVGALRYPSVKERRLSKKKPIFRLVMDDIECNIKKENKVVLHSLSVPRSST